jgi:CYTH domain-containing protein
MRLNLALQVIMKALLLPANTAFVVRADGTLYEVQDFRGKNQL